MIWFTPIAFAIDKPIRRLRTPIGSVAKHWEWKTGSEVKMLGSELHDSFGFGNYQKKELKAPKIEISGKRNTESKKRPRSNTKFKTDAALLPRTSSSWIVRRLT
jgi:hypothetical protein